MAEERDRSARYKQSGKGGSPAGTKTAASEAEKTAGGSNAPHANNPDKIGKVGADPGPDAGHDATWGVVAARHKREHGEMHKRHGEEIMGMHDRHASEAKAMHTRHASEMQDEMEKSATGNAEATAGSPKELGKDKPEGKGGSEP